MSLLPWLLLGTTLAVRLLLARRLRAGWWLDLATVPAWLAWYASVEAWPLLTVPVVFGALDCYALQSTWRVR